MNEKKTNNAEVPASNETDGSVEAGVSKKTEKFGIVSFFKRLFRRLRGVTDTPPPDVIAPSVDELFERADECYNKEDWHGAIAAFDEVLRLEPGNEKAYNNRGVAYSNLNEDDKAIADYTEALRLKPDYFTPYFGRAMLYNGQGDHKKALEDITEALRLDPKFARAYYERGIVRTAWHEHNAACEDFTEAIRLDRNFYEAYLHRAGTYIMRNEFGKALPDIKEALRIKPGDAQAKEMLARIRQH